MNQVQGAGAAIRLLEEGGSRGISGVLGRETPGAHEPEAPCSRLLVLSLAHATWEANLSPRRLLALRIQRLRRWHLVPKADQVFHIYNSPLGLAFLQSSISDLNACEISEPEVGVEVSGCGPGP